MKWFVPPVLFALCVGAMWLLGRFSPIAMLLHYPWTLTGFVPIAVGCLIAALGAGFFVRERTNIHPFREADKLVTRGIYRYTRNPMYLGLALILAGYWLFLGALSPVVCIIIFVVVSNRLYIGYEERMLAEKFGAEYSDYKRRVRRWI